MKIIRRRKVRIEVEATFAVESGGDGRAFVSIVSVDLPDREEAKALALAALEITDPAGYLERGTRSRIAEGLVRVHGARDNAIRYYRLVGVTRHRVRLQWQDQPPEDFTIRNGKEAGRRSAYWWATIHREDLAVLVKDPKAVLAAADAGRASRTPPPEES